MGELWTEVVAFQDVSRLGNDGRGLFQICRKATGLATQRCCRLWQLYMYKAW